ncbi:MAG: F390 synthetase-related protein [Hyphomonadaceae bacterium]
MTPQFFTLAAFAKARYSMLRRGSRAQIDAYQDQRVKRFLERHVPQVAAYKGATFERLQDAPVMDKEQLMDAFQRYNRLGLDADTGWKVFEGEQAAPEGFSIGASTGTSGNRGLYVVSDAERYEWLGVILSRAMPDLLKRRERVAVILPQPSALYDAANESKHLQLKFFDLAHGVEARINAVAEFNPTVIVAPPRVLTVLAEADTDLAPREVFSGAEVLDEPDRAVIEGRFGGPVREIYMATEGLFGVACRHGSLHLIEDRVVFEWEQVGSDGLVTPLVTDFTRRTQIMLRYRMNDLLRLSDMPCACGSPHKVVSEIVGRRDDAFRLMRGDGERVTITPDVIRNSVLDAHRGISDYKVTQTEPNAVLIELCEAESGYLEVAEAALRRLFDDAGVRPDLSARTGRLDCSGYAKRRRILVAKEMAI